MKGIIDEKGRVFGIINLIDFLVIIFLLLMAPLVYFGHKVIVMQKPQPVRSNIKEVFLNYQFVKLDPATAEKIAVGDKEMDARGFVTAEVIELGPVIADSMADGLKRRNVYLRLRLEFKEADLFYKDYPILYDSDFVFVTSKYSVVVKVKEELTQMLKMNISLKELNEETISLIMPGDKEKDSAGRTVAEIVNVGKPAESSFELELNGGRFTIVKIIDKKQITTEMILRCQKIDNTIYFKGKELSCNSPIDFVTDKYCVRGFLSKSYEMIAGDNQKSGIAATEMIRDE